MYSFKGDVAVQYYITRDCFVSRMEQQADTASEVVVGLQDLNPNGTTLV